jgi:bla regulator protein BlaR1
MIAYLIKSAVCLVLLLAAYHLLLEKEKMHRFNRLFLLAGMVFSLTIPALTIRVPQAAVAAVQVIPVNYVIEEHLPQVITTTTQPAQAENAVISYTLTLTDYLLIAYGVVAFTLLVRFVKNLYDINTRIRNGDQQRLENCTLVLVPQEIIPHSFFNYIFVNKAEYQSGTMDKQLLLHEFTHVNQKHSYDIVFIELLKIIFWFNPIFILYKKAIQLNHEFLADDGVLSTHINLKAYQHLLLSKAGFSHTLNLTSNFNYSITKKRLIMMNQNTPKLRAMLKATALAPVMLALVFAFCIKARAMPVKNALPLVDTVPQKAKILFPKPAGKGPYVSRRGKDGKAVFYKYVSDLTPAEKKKLRFPQPGSFYKPAKQSPNERQLQSWTKKSIYGIWLDGKHIKNDTLANYTTKDIVYYTSSPLTKYAINYPKNYFQVDLYTEDGYNEAFKTWKSRPVK